MDDIRSLLAIARSRLTNARFLRGLHLGLVGAAILMLLLVLFAKTSPAIAAALPWLWILLGTAVAALSVAFAVARSGAMTPMSLAVLTDERLGLKERLSTALGVKDRTDAFAQAAVADAVIVAKDPRTRESMSRAFPVRAPDSSWIGPVVALVAGLSWWLLPQGDFFKKAEEIQQINQVREEVKVATSEVKKAVEKNQQLKEALDKKLGDLAGENLAPNELPQTSEELRRDAIKKLTNTNNKLDSILKSEDAKQLEQVKGQLAKLGNPEKGTPTEDLAEALKGGDFKAAQEALEKLKAEAAKDPAKKAAIEGQLKDLAEQIGKLADSKEGVQNELKKAGLDPKLASSPEALENALKNAKNLNEQQKEQIKKAAQANQAASKKLQELSQACQGACDKGGGQKAGNKSGEQSGGQKDGKKQEGGSQGGGGEKKDQQGSKGASGDKSGGQQGEQQSGSGSGDMSQMLNDLEMIDQMMKDAEAAMQEAGKQAEGLGQCMGGMPGQNPNPGDNVGNIDGVRQGNRGRANDGAGQFQKSPTGTKIQKEKVEMTAGDIIARQAVEGQTDRGQSAVPLDKVIGDVTKSMELGTTADEIPQHLKELHKTYFGELKGRLERKKAAAAAPGPAAADGKDAAKPADSTPAPAAGGDGKKTGG